MYVIEYIEAHKLWGETDADDLPWYRYRPSFESEERANNEALWLSIDDDGRYVYRVMPEPGAA